jgi:hypothetical protein
MTLRMLLTDLEIKDRYTAFIEQGISTEYYGIEPAKVL